MAIPKYRDVDEMVAGLPGEERAIVNRLRRLIAECIPKAEEKAYYDWAAPFYKHNKLICYLWPYSPKGIQLGFNQGYLMSNSDGALLAEGRKQVYVLYIKTMKELNEDQVKALLFEASIIDERFKKSKRPRRT